MITAIVFVKADVARIPEVAEAIAALDGISEVYSVTGQIDLIALVRVRRHEDVAAVVADRLNKVDRRDLDRDPHRLPRLLPPRPGVGLRARPGLSQLQGAQRILPNGPRALASLPILARTFVSSREDLRARTSLDPAPLSPSAWPPSGLAVAGSDRHRLAGAGARRARRA